MGVRPSLVPWICSFLSNRKQRVKIGQSLSDWAEAKAGVPQGTKLGPVFFLVMVSDLKPFNTKSELWKYVDDITLSEIMNATDNNSRVQSDVDHISSWSETNFMKLNEKKCKELRVSFLREPLVVPNVTIDGEPIEIVKQHKLLGLCIQDDLKWDAHVDMIVKKASKRLHIIRSLKRSGLPPEDLINIYFSLIRSVLEYGCIVWHTGLPFYLSEKIERIQKRCFRIIYPHLHYSEVLTTIGCKTLADNRHELCVNYFKKAKTNVKVSHFLPNSRFEENGLNLRNKKDFTLPKCSTERFKNSFFPAMSKFSNQF